MKRNASAVLILLLVFVLVIALNFIFFVDNRGGEENEANGDRSSYRATAYGTKAFYTLLEEGGYPVSRFERPFTELKQSDPGTILVISPPPGTAHELTEDELNGLDKWIEKGGLAIIIDRDIHVPLGEATIDTERVQVPQKVRTLQPTELTRGVETVSLSDFATRVKVSSKAVTYHIGDEQAAVLADVKIGKGRAVFLTDPHVVANNGLLEGDNLVLALNLLADRPTGRIAFDEYHHGYGSSGPGGGLMAYFRGTPVPWMMWQIALVAALAVYSLGRRFGRPIPLRHERRTTNLEFVSSMAIVTRLARASDLAMQNIYSEFRKRLCRAAGLPPGVTTPKLATAAARRLKCDESELRSLMSRCEAIAQGEPVADSELLNLASRIREIESALRYRER